MNFKKVCRKKNHQKTRQNNVKKQHQKSTTKINVTNKSQKSMSKNNVKNKHQKSMPKNNVKKQCHKSTSKKKLQNMYREKLKETLISLITVEVGINMQGCKSCKINWNFPSNHFIAQNDHEKKIFIRFCKKIETSVMKSINMQGGFLFCAGWNFPKSVSVTSRLLER